MHPWWGTCTCGGAFHGGRLTISFKKLQSWVVGDNIKLAGKLVMVLVPVVQFIVMVKEEGKMEVRERVGR